MIDIALIRDPESLKLVIESQRKRGAPPELVESVKAMDEQWRKARFEADQVNRKINAIQKQIGELMKAKKADETTELKAQKTALEEEKIQLNKEADSLELQLNRKAATIGNLVHNTVPDSLTEDDNALIRMVWPEGRSEEAERKRRIDLIGSASVKDGAKGVKGLRSHHEIFDMLEGFDNIRGAKVAGHRAYFLTGIGVDLNLALIQYGLHFLESKGYTKLWTPFFMRREMMARTAQLEQFDEELYKVGEGGKADPDDVDADAKYLIATSEQPVSAFHSNEVFADPANELPKRYAGISTCFRKEAGAHGKDTWGIFRVHQFEKVEQFCITEPEKSWEEFDRMISNSEAFYQSLNIPYRVVAIVSGALNNAAAKKYDLEAWFPFQCEYKELVSCSNCTDYQSRSLDIRSGTKPAADGSRKFVHMLNSTLTATERALCCLVENYQTEDGLVIPEALRPYMGGKSFVPFTRQAPSWETKGQVVSKKANVAKVTDGVKDMSV